EINAAHHGARRERVAQVVEMKVLETGAFEDWIPIALEIVNVAASRRSEHESTRCLKCAVLQCHYFRSGFPESSERTLGRLIHQNVLVLTGLGIANRDGRCCYINIAPSELQELAFPHARVECDDDQRLELIGQRGEEGVFFLLAE